MIAVPYIMEQSPKYEAKTVDQDGLWKKIISELFEDFLIFFGR